MLIFRGVLIKVGRLVVVVPPPVSWVSTPPDGAGFQPSGMKDGLRNKRNRARVIGFDQCVKKLKHPSEMLQKDYPKRNQFAHVSLPMEKCRRTIFLTF